ncbi:phage antirepressor KilAC domain-containing protein [Serratia bockelmannii]|uniref:phage antirepressor KilAC domain-containing protein n=1 Tax=Serratia bockelmannii TaxID=2703793 RepID=UPI002FE517B7
MYSVTEKSMPVIAGVEITTDEEGRFNLNALHKASGLGTNKAPAQWLRTQSSQSLIAELEKETVQICIVSVEGRNGGTFAHELLAVEYAGWISPAFRLKVNQTFIDYRSGKLRPSALPSAKELALMVIQAEEEKERLKSHVNLLENQVHEDAPKVEFHDKVAVAPGAMSVAQAAKILGTGRTRLFQFLRQIAWVTRYNEPYQEKIEAGYLDVKLGSWDHPDHGVQQSVTALITGKGLTKLQKLWAER